MFVLRHPDDPTARATYGHDPARGFWVELVYQGVVVVYDATNIGYDVESPVLGMLAFLCEFNFFGGEDLIDAVEWLSLPLSCHPHRLRRGVRRVIAIHKNLNDAAG